MPLHHLVHGFNSELVTVFTIAINIAGGGLLVLPLAMHNASVVFGTVLLLVCAAASVFTAQLVVIGCEMTGATSLPTAFALTVAGPSTDQTSDEEQANRTRRRRTVAAIVDAMVAMYAFGMLVMYVIVVADVCSDAAAALTDDPAWRDRTRYVGASFLLFFGLTCKRQLSELTWSTVLGVTTVFFIAFAMLFEYGLYSVNHKHAAHSGVRWLSVSADANSALPVMTVALGYHYNVPAMYQEMEGATPRRFMRAVRAATFVCVLLYISVGLTGYFTFGDGVADPAAGGSIINNYARGDRLFTVARFAFAAHLICVFPVVAISVRDALHRLSLRVVGLHDDAEDPDLVAKTHISFVVLEAAVVCGSAVATAVSTPNIGYFVNIIGVVFGIFLVFIAPAIMGLAINGGVWRNSEEAACRLRDVAFEIEPSTWRELVSLGIAASFSVAALLGLLSVLGLLS
jgi:amino acid permease